MSPVAITFIVLGIVIVLLVVIIVSMYNSLVKLNERVEEAWSDITVQLKRRADLIPNIAETVKGYAKQEKDIIKDVADARAKMMGARSVASTAEADRSMLGALSRIMAISESYPELKSNENFQQLAAELSDTEDKIQAARRFYNAGARELNMKVKVFPINLFKGFGFKTREYYNVDEAESEKINKAPEVKFN